MDEFTPKSKESPFQDQPAGPFGSLVRLVVGTHEYYSKLDAPHAPGFASFLWETRVDLMSVPGKAECLQKGDACIAAGDAMEAIAIRNERWSNSPYEALQGRGDAACVLWVEIITSLCTDVLRETVFGSDTDGLGL